MTWDPEERKKGSWVWRQRRPEGTYLFWSFVYVIVHDQFGALKIGMSTGWQTATRGREHTDLGWRVYRWEKIGQNQHWGEAVESYALTILRERGLEQALAPEQMPQKGSSETFWLKDISPEDAWALLMEGTEVVQFHYQEIPRPR